jgi:hypothetical protein
MEQMASLHGISRSRLHKIHGNRDMESLVQIVDLLEAESRSTDLHIRDS